MLDWSSVQCPPSGPLDAKIVIVGEAPGEHEVIQRAPFVGASGRLLDQMLRNSGIDRSSCYLTNVVKNRPLNNEFSNLYERTKTGKFDAKRQRPTEVLAASIEVLRRELHSLQPNVIICLGGESLRAITGCRGIEKWRGSILSSPFGKVIGTYHPAAVLRTYSDRWVAELDLRRAAEESRTKELNLPKCSFILRPKLEDVLAYLYRPRLKIAFDIETIGTHVRCLGLSDSRNEAICIPFICKRGNENDGVRNPRLIGGDEEQGLCSYWSSEDEYRILQALNLLFRDTSVEKIAQNFPFDSTVLAMEFGFDIDGDIKDTMLKHYTCYTEMPKGLDFLCSIYTRHPYYSDYQSSDDLSTWTYNCYDAAVTFEVDEVLDKELREARLNSFYSLHLQPTSLAMTRAQNRGVKIDLEERNKQRVNFDIKIKQLEEKLREITKIPDLNPSSPKQMATLLYDRLGLPPQRHHKTKNITVGKDAMEALANKCPEHAELFSLLREHSSCETLRDGFLSKELLDGRIRTSFNTAGTVTGRLASSESFLYPSTNLQNIQRTSAGPMRKCFVSDDGWLLLKADLSQAEFRGVVWVAKIHRIIQRYKDDPSFDVHRWVASIIYKKLESEVTKVERGIAKNGVYGGNYKMYYVTAARTYKLALSLAKFVLEEYRRAIPEIPRWWGDIDEQLRKTRTLTNEFGRRRVFLGRVDDEMFRSGYSHRIQSLVADIINRAVVLVDEFFDPSECHLLLQVHDELVLQVREDKVLFYARALRSLMEVPIKCEGVEEDLVIPAEVTVGRNWYDQKEIEGL